MGETVSRKAQEVSRVFLNDPLLNLEQFDPNLMGAADCWLQLYRFDQKTVQKHFYGG